jgi:hypothetical protein
MGVKTLSPLVLIPEFDIVRSFTIDYMHVVLLGVVKQFMDLWFNTKYHKSPWYMGDKIGTIDGKLLKLKPPCDIKRLPRSLARYSTFKATECKNWLLYYSIFVMNGFLPIAYLKHWVLLVDAIYYLISYDIKRENLPEIERKLFKFVVWERTFVF